MCVGPHADFSARRHDQIPAFVPNPLDKIPEQGGVSFQTLELPTQVAGTVVAGKRYSFPQRSLLWFFPSQEHQLVDRSADAAYYVAVFKPEMLQHACCGPAYAPLRRKRPTTQGVLHTELALQAGFGSYTQFYRVYRKAYGVGPRAKRNDVL